MTIKKVKQQLKELADTIDDYLGKLEQKNKDNSSKYETLFYISGGIRELIDYKS